MTMNSGSAERMWRRAAVVAALCVSACVAGVASASTVTVLPGGALTLGNSYTVASPTSIASALATNNDLSGNSGGSYTYANGFGAAQSAIAATGVPASTYGFYDSWVFTVTGSTADSITSTINLTSGSAGTHLSNLDVQLFMLSGNPNLPSFVPNNSVADLLSVTNFSLTPGVSGTTVVLSPTAPLGAGTYVLEIRGLVDGSSGGSYSGVLNVVPVPLPAAGWLLGAIGGLGLLVRRRRPTAP
jgi:hypothetical protein